MLQNEQGDYITDDNVKAEKFSEYFLNSVAELKQGIETSIIDNWKSLRTLQTHDSQFRLRHVLTNEVGTLIRETDRRRSSDSDNISPRALIECNDELSPVLYKIFNNIIDTSIYPDILKIHKIVPIPKEARANEIAKYRPIALLSIVDKIFEKLLHSQLSLYLQNADLLFESQYGFQRGCGTEEAVVNVVNCICDSLDRGFSGVGGIFYDFSKAFDLVDHNTFYEKLSYYGINGSELALFKSYLENRRQYVQINASCSSVEAVQYGVPQGSVLGPLLFKLYINDISNLELSGKLYMYADDICILYPYKENLILKL